MSALFQRARAFISSEERMKKKAKKALDIADRIIVEMRAQQINIKKCCDYQESMLDNLHKVMDGALKIGNKPLYMQSGKLAEIVGEWHIITKQMKSDESIMIQFISMVKVFYTALMEYKQIVTEFTDTTKRFTSLKRIGVNIPTQIKEASIDAAGSFRELVDSVVSMKGSYTELASFVMVEDEDKWSKRFDEERSRLLERSSRPDNDKT